MQQTDVIRLSVFISVLLLCAVWEWVTPRKQLTQRKWQRWLNNLGLIGFNSLCLNLLMPILAVETAIWASKAEFGLFNIFDLGFSFELLLSVLILDFAIYLQHLVFHRIPILWKLHRMHHADQDIDVTTGARFHPIEIVLSMWIKVILVALLGINPISVLVFEVILNASAMFNHSNAKLPLKLDFWLRKIVVTPDMHRVHHSVETKETHSNFGFFLSVWDKWLGTYIAQPQRGHNKVIIGIPQFRTPREQWLDRMLSQPFRKN